MVIPHLRLRNSSRTHVLEETMDFILIIVVVSCSWEAVDIGDIAGGGNDDSYSSVNISGPTGHVTTALRQRSVT